MNLVFDLDDTLYDLAEPFRRAHTEIFAEQLGEECEELFRKSRIYSDEVLALEKQGMIPSEDAFYHRIYRTYQDAGLEISRETSDRFEEIYRYYQKHISVPEEIKELLNHCKRAGHHMAILTNGNIKNQGSKIDVLEIKKWFLEENIFISEMTGYHKPSPGAFQYVENHMELEPGNIWYIGDTYESDVLGAKQVGWHTIWFNHRRREVPTKENVADITVHTVEELFEAIRQKECEVAS